MHARTHWFTLLALLSVFSCSEPLDDTACTRNDDCESGYACNSSGVCVEAAKLQIVTLSIMDAFTGETYSELVIAAGGIEAYTWSLSPQDPADTRLDWIEIAADTGEIRNKAGEFPGEMGAGLGVTVTVRDSSNRGEGQEYSRDFKLNIKECRGDQTCWEYGEDQGTWGCRQGTQVCVDGALSGQCVLGGWSTSTDHCGEGCGVCNEQVADRCVGGNCACGQTGGPCPADRTCCSGSCSDLNDLSHCGACDSPCQPQNVASASCSQGICTYDQCNAGFYDCDGNRANGCETASGLDDCGGCDDACTSQALYPNTTGHSCPAGVCLYQCVLGFADCDAGTGGCETALGTVQNCSACFDACDGSAAGGKACIDVGGTLRCGCTSEADCDGDDMCCSQTCTPHDTDHCADCDTGCTIGNGGPICTDAGGGVYACQCSEDPQCKGAYSFSAAYCDTGGTDKCLCTASELCAGTVQDMCCFASGANSCVDLTSNAGNCGICRTACSAGEVCADGACSCSGGTCPFPSGAPNCVSGECVCFFYGGEVCPAGQYCCSNEGCCLGICGTLNNECSIACINAGDVWCDWGCCTTCQSEADCPTAIQ